MGYALPAIRKGYSFQLILKYFVAQHAVQIADNILMEDKIFTRFFKTY